MGKPKPKMETAWQRIKRMKEAQVKLEEYIAVLEKLHRLETELPAIPKCEWEIPE